MKFASQRRKTTTKSLSSLATRPLFISNGESFLSSEDSIDNYRQKIFSIIHCEKPVVSLYNGLSPGGLGRISGAPREKDTIVATSASMHVKPKSKTTVRANADGVNGVSNPTVTVSNSKDVSKTEPKLQVWQKHYSFYFPEFNPKEELTGSRSEEDDGRILRSSDNMTAKCVIRTMPKTESLSPFLKTSYFPTVEFTNSFPRKNTSRELKLKQGNSNSAEIKIDLSAECRLNNDGKNVLSYKAYDGWQIAIPFTPSPAFGENLSRGCGSGINRHGMASKDRRSATSKADRILSPKLQCITPFADQRNGALSKSATRIFLSPGDACNTNSITNFAIDTVSKINSSP